MKNLKTLLLFLLLLGSVSAYWEADSWEYRKQVNLTSGVDETLTDFPVHIVMDTASLISAGKMQGDCDDIRIMNSSVTGELSYEIETGTCNTSETVLWVKIPALYNSSTVNTVYVYYGNSTVLSGEDVLGVWDNGYYHMVLHLSDGNDSVSGTEICTGLTFNSTGGVYGGARTAGTCDLGYKPAAIAPSGFGVWFKGTDNGVGQSVFGSYTANYKGWYIHIRWNHANNDILVSDCGGNNVQVSAGVAVTPDTWLSGRFIRRSTTDFMYYENYTAYPLAGYSGTTLPTNNVCLGARSYSGSCDNAPFTTGTIDEFRAYNSTSITNEYLLAEYSQGEVVGAEEIVGGGGNITVTLNAPTHLEVLYDKQVTFNYSVGMNNSPKNTNCSLYLDTINIFNDTTTTNDSFQHEHNTTFGNHTWSVFCYQNSTQNGTSVTFSFSVERNIELSQLLPAEASTTYNKTINASYELEANDNATCNFYFDGAHTYTDTYTHNETGPFNTTFNHIFSTTYGEHNWSIYCEMDNESEINETTDTRNFTIIFAVILVSPDNGVTLAGNTTNFEYTTTNLYQITCNISLDAAYIDEQTISSSGTRNYLSAVSDGSHIWHVKCFGGDNPDYSVQTTSRTFIMNVENYTYVVDLTSGPQNVLDSPQSLFYDIDGYLNALYFEDASPTDYLRIKTVNGSDLLTSYNTTLNATKSFFLVIRNPTNTSLITFGWDNSTEYIIDLDATGPNAILSEEPTTWNVLGNAVFDPYNYACTKQYDTIDYVADSHYFFMVPTTAGTKLVKKNITSAELEDIGTVNDNCNIVWNTMAKNQNLTQWYYVAPENYLTNNYISLYVYDGSGSTEIKQFDTDLYSQARVEGITVIFEEYEGKTYVLMANATDNSANPQDRIYIIEDNVTYEFGQNLEVPSHFFFIDENTFVFFDMRADATYAYSCYSNGSNLNCDEFSAAEYGLTVPYERGTMTTAKRTEENYDEVSKGAIVSADTVQLQYNQNIYNTKFICYDEQQEYRQQFKPRILSDTNSILASTYLWGYVIPGAEIGTGLKKVYNLGENGTLRMYLVGLDWGWNLDFYSLNETQGEYYTFTIKNQFNSPLEDVKVSAYRFSVVKNAFVVVEQGITDSTGAVTFFLEPFTPYRIVSEKDGYLVSTFDFVPTSTTEVEILLNQVETGIIADPSYESIWADVAYNFTPGGGFYNESVQFNFSCYSTDAAIEYYGVNVWKTTNGSTSLYYTNNITSQPSGGLIQVMLNKTENRTVRYVVDFWFKRQNYSSFEPVIPPTITIGEKKGLALVSRLFSGGNLMSPFFFYLIAIVIAMLVGGFVSQYTVEGAGLSSLAVLWIFTLFWLDAVIVAEPEITSLMATSLATLMVGAAMIIKHYV